MDLDCRLLDSQLHCCLFVEQATDGEREHLPLAWRKTGVAPLKIGEPRSFGKSRPRTLEEAGEHIPTFFLAVVDSAGIIEIEREDWSAAKAYIDELYRRCGTHARFRRWADALSAIVRLRLEPSAAALERLALVLEEDGWQAPSRNFWYRLQLAKGCIACGQADRARVLLNELAELIRGGQNYAWLLPDVLRQQAGLLSAAAPAEASLRYCEAVRCAKALGAAAVEASIATEYLRRMGPALAPESVQRFLASPLRALLDGFDTMKLFATVSCEQIDAGETDPPDALATVPVASVRSVSRRH